MFHFVHAVCHHWSPLEVLKIALTSTRNHPGSERKSRLRLHRGTSPNLSAQSHRVDMNVRDLTANKHRTHGKRGGTAPDSPIA